MEKLNIVFHLISFLLALLAAALLLFVNKERKHSNRLLAFVMIAFACQNLMLVLLFSKLMLLAPGLLRVFGPMTFLIGPAAYLYIRSVLYDELRFKRNDWLLCIPAFLAFVNFIPFYLTPIQEKIEFLQHNFYGTEPNQDSGKGIIPNPAYYSIRVLWSVFFIVGGFRLISIFKKENAQHIVENNRVLISWLFAFNCLLTTVLVATFLKIFMPPIKGTQLTIADLVIAGAILFICLQLFLRPRILYGMFQPAGTGQPIIQVDADKVINDRQVSPITDINTPSDKEIEPGPVMNMGPEEQLRYKQIVEDFFSEKKPYLQADYNLEQLVKDVKVPRYILSAFINKEYGIGFREYINRYRIDFFKDNLHNARWKNLTLEAIAEECGFSSRSTFIYNFKKIVGQTPSDYVNGLADGPKRDL